MSGALQLYHTFYQALQPFWRQGRKENLKTLALLMVGIFQSGEVRLGRIAPKTPLPWSIASVTQRFRRFLKNPHVDERGVYDPLIRQVVWGLRHTQLYLQMDRTLMDDGFNVLSVSFYLRKRALPLAWCLLPHKGCSGSDDWRPLLEQVNSLLPPNARVLLLGDREFGVVALMELARELEWDYCLRVKGSNYVKVSENGQWTRVRRLTPQKGTAYCLTDIAFTKSSVYRTHLVVAYEGDDPCFVVTNRIPSRRTLHQYARRFGCEALFSDLKKRGFDLESSQLVHPERFSRLLLAVALLTIWVWTVARRVKVTGQAAALLGTGCVDDYSLFQIGYRWLQKQLTWGDPLIPDPGFAFWHFVRK